MKDELIVITGSSSKFGKEIYELALAMIDKGETVVVDSMFHNLSEPRARKQFMKMILDASKLLVYNKNGYIGFHTQFEIALAEIAGVEVEYLFQGTKYHMSTLEDLYYQWKERGF